MSDKKGIGARLKGAIGDGGSKRMLYFAGALVAGAVVYSMIPADPPASNPGSYTSPPTVESTQGKVALPPNYEKAVSEDDRVRCQEAQQAGGTCIPTVRANPSGPGTTVMIPITESEPAQPPEHSKPDLPVIEQKPVIIAPTVQPVPIVAPSAPTPTVDPGNLGSYMAQIGRKTYAVAEVQYMYTEPAAAPQGQSAPQAPAGGAASAAASRVPLPLAGEVVYAQLIGRANSDSPGPVIAQILQGPLTGARLIGSFSTGRDALVITFTKLTMKKNADGEEINETVAINAVAVDTKHIGTALATSVDRHLFQKLGIGLAASFAEGFGKAVATNNSTSVLRSDGSYTTTTEKLSGREQALSAGGQAISSAGNILMDEFGRRPTTIIVDADTPIGVLFL